ncbi:MAG: hypothetical protein ACN6PQ_10765 [Stenotrophomonas indicatrix]|uniref:hypothetical protein n=1 Tax=Stenotrophomonas indicatrix TaxID=2045451 RepID=UPI003D0F77DA
MIKENTAASLRAKFEVDDLDPRLEALDLMTSFHCTIRFLEFFQAAILDPQQRERSIADVYTGFLVSLGEISTADDLPSCWSGQPPGANERQAMRNLRMPMGLGALAAYLSMNLARGKEIVSTRIPDRCDDETLAAWSIDKFEELEDTRPAKPTVATILTRLRNAISHHQFKLRVRSRDQTTGDFRDDVYATFLDHSTQSTFYARASFRTLELLMEKLRMAEYDFHQCPRFEGDAYDHVALKTYVESCFSHFARGYKRHKIGFHDLKRLDPESEYQVMVQSGTIELSRSDMCKYAARFSVNGEPSALHYIDIPFLDPHTRGYITMLGEPCLVGDNPIDWMLHNARSPLYQLDRQIKEMLETVLAETV